MHLYKSFILVLLTLGFVLPTSGQFGLNLSYTSPANSPDWDEAIADEDGLQSAGMGVALDYWFRLKNYRVEFLPEIGASWGAASRTIVDAGVVGPVDADARWLQYHLLVNINLYPFDFEGDCNCPTFGKDGGVFKKGFFLQAGAGASALRTEIEQYSDQNSSIAGIFHVGAGLDIGAGEYLTLTPWVRYNYRLQQEWAESESLGLVPPPTSTSIFLTAGLRIGYRWDYKRR
jgi:hypothetical protein